MLKKILLGLLALIFLLAIAAFLYYRLAIYQPPLISEEDRASVSLMPLPAKMDIKSGFLDLSNGIEIKVENNEDELIQKAISRFATDLDRIYDISTTKKAAKLSISYTSNGNSSIPYPQMDESYSLKVRDGIELKAAAPWGIIRGLETVLQLIQVNDYGNPAILKLKLEDQPAYKWRGLMLDVSRHWMPKEVVLRILDEMASVKMNVFHWHLSDDQGFRVESKLYPKLHEVGSNGHYYTQEEIKEIIDFAAERGIRIVPEFDIPGHSKSWQIAYPQLSSVDYDQKFGRTSGEMFFPPLDPSKEEVYQFIDNFIGEMAALFPDPYFHIGGDEVEAGFWEGNTEIVNFMDEKNLMEVNRLQAYFNRRVKQLLDKHNKKMVGWQEIMNPDLGNDIVIQSWLSHKSLFETVQSGAKAILSNGWYLDHKLHAENYYRVDPLVLPNAVDITPDSSNWKMYDIKIDFSGNQLAGQIVLFDGDPANVYGFMELMNSMIVFRNGTLENGELNFELETPMGKLAFSANITDELLDGKISLALLKFDCTGELAGGSNIPGSLLPEIEVIKPLTDEEKERVLGGEAAMWSEVVGPANVESRIWPGSAAIAEKLWSPSQLTGDTDDMYRRLEAFSVYLGRRGSPHLQQMNSILEPLIEPQGFSNFITLVELLEEVKYYGRLTPVMAQKDLYLPDLPLDGIADAARPVSFKARKFNKLVQRYVETSNAEDLIQIELQLANWSRLNKELQPYLTNDKLQVISKILHEFSFVSGELLSVTDENENWSDAKIESVEDKLNFLETGENGVTLAVVPGLRQLLSIQKTES